MQDAIDEIKKILQGKADGVHEDTINEILNTHKIFHHRQHVLTSANAKKTGTQFFGAGYHPTSTKPVARKTANSGNRRRQVL